MDGIVQYPWKDIYYILNNLVKKSLTIEHKYWRYFIVYKFTLVVSIPIYFRIFFIIYNDLNSIDSIDILSLVEYAFDWKHVFFSGLGTCRRFKLQQIRIKKIKLSVDGLTKRRESRTRLKKQNFQENLLFTICLIRIIYYVTDWKIAIKLLYVHNNRFF